MSNSQSMFVYTERNESSHWIQDHFPGTRTLHVPLSNSSSLNKQNLDRDGVYI